MLQELLQVGPVGGQDGEAAARYGILVYAMSRATQAARQRGGVDAETAFGMLQQYVHEAARGHSRTIGLLSGLWA